MSHRRIQGGKLNFRGAKKIKFRALYASEARTIGKKTNGLKSYSLNYISLGIAGVNLNFKTLRSEFKKISDSWSHDPRKVYDQII